MLKNLILYRIGATVPPSAEALAEALAAGVFVPCGATARESFGWVPPRGIEHGALVEAIDGHWLLKLQTEQRLLPSSVIKDRVEEIAETIEQETGRKPGKKAMRDLKEQAEHELLPLAFTRRTSITAWIAPEAKLLVIDATSEGRAEPLVSLLIKSVNDLNLHRIQSTEPPSACMAAWLMDGEGPAGFTVDREGEFKSEDEMKSIVKYQRHALDTDEVRQHLDSGKRPTRLAMTYKDRVSFVLTDDLAVKKLSLLDLVFEGRDKPARDEQFDADAVLFCGELAAMLPELIDALGGEYVMPIIAAAEGKPVDVGQPPHMPGDGDDPLYDQAVELVQHHRKASISLVQRHLRIGYNRAARLLEEMEKAGLVSAMQTDGSRQVREGATA